MSILDRVEQETKKRTMIEVAVRLLENKASLETVMIATGFTSKEVMDISTEIGGKE